MTQWKVTLRDLRLPCQHEIVTSVLEECNATLFRVKHCSLIAGPWRWRDCAPPKCWQLNSSKHNETSQKTWTFEGHTVCICCCLKPTWGFFLSYWCTQHKFLLAQWFLTPHHTTDAFPHSFAWETVFIFYQYTQHTFLYAFWILSLYHIGTCLPPSLAYQFVSNQVLH